MHLPSGYRLATFQPRCTTCGNPKIFMVPTCFSMCFSCLVNLVNFLPRPDVILYPMTCPSQKKPQQPPVSGGIGVKNKQQQTTTTDNKRQHLRRPMPQSSETYTKQEYLQFGLRATKIIQDSPSFTPVKFSFPATAPPFFAFDIRLPFTPSLFRVFSPRARHSATNQRANADDHEDDLRKLPAGDVYGSAEIRISILF